MRTAINHLIVLLLPLVLSCSQSNTSTSTDHEVEAEDTVSASFSSRPLSHEDSAYFHTLIDKLNGIEKFAVGDNFYFLTSVLRSKGETKDHEKAMGILSGFIEDPSFQLPLISELDSKNGYIRYAPPGAEVTYTKVYWNLTDGTQMIATESWACGPICESEIYFSKYEKGKYKSLDLPDVIPQINELPPTIDESGVPLEYQFVLPRQGKDIKYCLDEKCITLKWAEGRFIMTP